LKTKREERREPEDAPIGLPADGIHRERCSLLMVHTKLAGISLLREKLERRKTNYADIRTWRDQAVL
jgi:hypothetical protein